MQNFLWIAKFGIVGCAVDLFEFRLSRLTFFYLQQVRVLKNFLVLYHKLLKSCGNCGDFGIIFFGERIELAFSCF